MTALKLITHAQCINHRHNAIQLQIAVLDILWSQRWNAHNGLGYRTGFANATGLNDDIVETVHGQYLLQLFHEVHLQRTADTAILKSHQRVVLLTHYSTLFYQVGIDVYLTDIIDYDGKLNALLILQYAVQKCRLTAA